MKSFRLYLIVILLSILFLIGYKMYRDFDISRDLKNEEKNKLKKSAAVLNKCFDLKNKGKRSLNDSLKLIEFCLEEYGSEK